MDRLRLGRLDIAMVGGGVAALRILDTFTDTNGVRLASHTVAPTNIPGSAWVEAQYTWDIQGNRASSLQVISATHIAVIESGVSNCVISATLNMTTVATILFRYLDTNNFWVARLDVLVGTFTLYECNAGAYTLRATKSMSILISTDYLVVVTLSGASIKATIDGANEISYSSSLHQANTKHGLSADYALATFDNFTVTAL
jgi:hypothetical protein